MKKKLTTLLLALLLCLGLSAPAFAEDAAPPLQATAYATNKLLWIGPIPLAGLTVINGEYYMPLELLNGTGRLDSGLPISEYYISDGCYVLSPNTFVRESVTVMKPVLFAKEGRAIGDVTLDTVKPLKITAVGPAPLQYPNAVYTFGAATPWPASRPSRRRSATGRPRTESISWKPSSTAPTPRQVGGGPGGAELPGLRQ